MGFSVGLTRSVGSGAPVGSVAPEAGEVAFEVGVFLFTVAELRDDVGDVASSLPCPEGDCELRLLSVGASEPAVPGSEGAVP